MIGFPRPSPTTDEVTPEQRDHLKSILGEQALARSTGFDPSCIPEDIRHVTALAARAKRRATPARSSAGTDFREQAFGG